MARYLPVLLVGMCFSSGVFAQAAVYVAKTGSDAAGDGTELNPYLTITNGIAKAADGGMVLVNDGKYNEYVLIDGRAVTVRSLNGPASTGIDGQGLGRGARLNHNAAVLSGFTISNCVAGTGAGLRIDSGMATNCWILGNTNLTDVGGGVWMYSSASGRTSILAACWVADNYAIGGGGGIYLTSMWPHDGCAVSVSRCRIENNYTDVGGGGIHVWRGNNQWIVNCIISNNTAQLCGGGVYKESIGTLDIQDSEILYNTSYGTNNEYESGGGVGVRAGLTRIRGCQVSYNTAVASCGGGLGVLSSGSGLFYVYNSIILSNRATRVSNRGGYGGGIFIQDKAISGITHIDRCNIIGNSADLYGGGLSVRAGDEYCVNVSNSVIRANRSGQGGGASLRGRGEGRDGGRFLNCLLIGNQSSVAGGGLAIDGSVVLLALENLTITGNRTAATTGGGGIYWPAVGTVRNSIVYGNEAPDAIPARRNYNFSGTIVENSCLAPAYAGTGNIADDPEFLNPGSGSGLEHVEGNDRLKPVSPCIDRAVERDWMVPPAKDLGGMRRIYGVAPDMGCYEFSPNGTIMTFY